MKKWNELIELLESNAIAPDFVAECIYAHIEEFSEGEDDELSDQLRDRPPRSIGIFSRPPVRHRKTV